MRSYNIFNWIDNDEKGKPIRYITEFIDSEEYYDNYGNDESGNLKKALDNSTISSVSYNVRENYITFCECTQKKYSLSMEELFKLVMSHWNADMQKTREEDAD